MSIASTVTSLERANAAYRAAQAAVTPVARRGMFALVEREHRYSYLCGAHAGHVSYIPDMSGAQLDGAVLTRVDLQKANLRGAGFRNARLDEADLRGARLGGAFLVGASLRGADLRGAYLRSAKLDGADLSDANLYDAEGLTQTQLDLAQLSSGTKLPEDL